MAVAVAYRNQLLIILLLLILLLLILPGRAETAGNGYAAILSGPYDTSWFSREYQKGFASTLHLPSLFNNNTNNKTPEPSPANKALHIHSYTSRAPYQQSADSDRNDDPLLERLKARIHPLLEISYSLGNRIALELQGHLNRYAGNESAARDVLYGYTLIFGPSIYSGKPGDTGRFYTQFGLGYKILETASYLLSGDCPASMGTGVSLGFKMEKSDIRFGVNRFQPVSDTSSPLRNSQEDFDPSSIFFFVTYNFDS